MEHIPGPWQPSKRAALGLGMLTGQHICKTSDVILRGQSHGGPCEWNVDGDSETYLWHFCPYCGLGLPSRGAELRDAIVWPGDDD